MLGNYLKIALRNLWRHKGFTFINVTGLALGLACSIVIFLYVRGETGYDQYHQNKERIYRITLGVEGIKSGSLWHSATSSILWAPVLKKEYPEVVDACRVMQEYGDLKINVGEDVYFEDKTVFADKNWFRFFSWPLIEGNRASALSEPFTLILNQSTANKYFGDEPAMGKTIRVTRDRRNEAGEMEPQIYDFKVAGVIEDIPYKSHLKPDIIFSFITLNTFFEADVTGGVHPNDWYWRGRLVHNYLLLTEQADPDQLIAKFPQFLDKYIGDATETRGYRYHPHLEPLANIHLEGQVAGTFETGADKTRLYIFSGIALIILMLAAINFMNLSTARSTARMREVGIRKVIGANRRRLFTQFIGESVLMSLIALLFAFLLFEFINPVFYQYLDKEFYLPRSEMLWSFAGIFLITVCVGLFAGSYPAFYLSSFRPAHILKSQSGGKSGSRVFRKTLVVVQFTVTVFFIIATITLFFQLRYMQSQSLGFTDEPVVVLPQNVTAPIIDQADVIKNDLLKNSDIVNVSLASAVPGRSYGGDVWVEKGKSGDEGFGVSEFAVDYQFLDLFDLDLVAGRNFNRQMGTDAAPDEVEESGFELAAIVNEAAVNAFGWKSPEDALNRRIIRDPVSNDFTGRIIGVVKDFHYESLQEPIEPMVFFINPHYSSQYRYLAVKLSGHDIPKAIDHIRATVGELPNEETFDYFFIDKNFEQLYRDDRRMMEVYGYVSLLSILIACLGLFGLASYMTERRVKEIGIRKVLGASVTGIVGLLTGEFIRLILVSIVIVTPVAYLLMNRWLQNYAYRIDLSWWIFVLGGSVAMLIAMFTVSWQAIRAANSNPANALRYE